MAAKAKDPPAFLKAAANIEVNLKAWRTFAEELVPGYHKPRLYRADAAKTIGVTIAKWITDAHPKGSEGIRKYFQAAQPSDVAGPNDLYD